MISLTEKQRKLFDYIKEFTAQNHGTAPNYRQMADFLGVKSTSRVATLIIGLEARGAIHRLHGKFRAIGIGPSPVISQTCPKCGYNAEAIFPQRGFYPKPKACRYPFYKMEIGESVEVDATNLKSARVTAARYKREGRGTYSIKKSVTGFRCWRVA